MKTTKLLTVALLAGGTFAFIAGCDDKNPIDPPQPQATPTQNGTGIQNPADPPTTGPGASTTAPSAADSTNTPSMGSGGLAPATPNSTPSTQPNKSQSSTGGGSGKESLIGSGIDTGSVGASVPIDTDAGIVPPTRDEKSGKP